MSVQPGKRTVRKPTALEEYEGDLGPYDDGHDGKWSSSHDEYGRSRSNLGSKLNAMSGGGGIFKSAAVEVLRKERRLMTTGEITKIALQRGFLNAQGKTPEATMASALYTDVKKKNGTSLFTRPQEGLFGLKEWLDEGFYPEGFFAGGGPHMEFDQETGTAFVSGAYRRRAGPTPPRVRQLPGRSSKHRARQTWANEASDDDDAQDSESYYPEHQDVSNSDSGHHTDHHADPLHMLGDACLTHAEKDTAGHRRRPALAVNTEPDDTYEEATRYPMPSPGDKLLTLHEVATSPMPYAAKSYINATDMTIHGSTAKQRKKLSVAIPEEEGKLQDGDAAAASAAMLLAQSPLGAMMASLVAEAARTGKSSAGTTPWFPGMSYAQLFSPGSAYLDPSNPLATPSWAGLAAGFDALGGGTDLLGQLAQNMGISSSVIAGLSGLTPRSTHGRRSQNHLGKADHSPRGGKSSAAANGGWGVDYASPVTKAGTKRSYSAAIRSEVEGRGSPMLNTESGLPETNGRGVGSPDKVYSDLNALEQWQHTIEQAEQHWGPSHPAVGRAWLELARALQAADKDSEKARHATKKAFDICQILLKQTAMESHAYDSFQYLMAKFNQKAAAAKEAKKEAAAAREAAAKKHSTAQQPSSHKSASGKAVGTSRHAPASTVDADSKLQEALRVSAPALFSPTDILMSNGTEAAADDADMQDL
eukprot:jgi/Chrzof1/11835/Cz06g11210.t1